MNVVFIEHNNQSGTYLFEVPAGVKLGKGETVMVETSCEIQNMAIADWNGEKYETCTA